MLGVSKKKKKSTKGRRAHARAVKDDDEFDEALKEHRRIMWAKTAHVADAGDVSKDAIKVGVSTSLEGRNKDIVVICTRVLMC